MMSKKLTYIHHGIIVAIYLSLAIGLEFLYRDSLFTHSLTWEKEWQSKGSKSLENFFKILTQFGTQAALIPLLVICLLYLPLQKSYCFTSVLVYSVFFDNINKIFYGNPRPFWVDTTLFKSCDGGFGNPSGHSFSSSSVYLSLWHLLTDYPFFKDTRHGIVIRIILLILAVTLIIGIMLTRIFLGVHGVNQVLYGASLGVALYYIVFHAFSLQKWTAEEFFNLFKTAINRFIFTFWFAALLVSGLIVWKYKVNDTSQWAAGLLSTCPDLKEYRKFNNDGLFGMLVLFVLIGCHYGIMFLIHMTNKKYMNKLEEINFWHESSTCRHHLYRIIILIVFALPMIMVAAIPSSSSLSIIYIFKISVPYLLTLFGFYGPSILVSIQWGYGNKEILYIVANSDIETPSYAMNKIT